ncbi:unnamed protein product [Amaranthus hypochondriacus]
MDRVATSTFTFMILLFAIILNISAPRVAAAETCRDVGEFCGGIVGYECCKGIECVLDGDYADAGGECKRNNRSCQLTGEFCGGIAGLPCCKGLDCVKDGDFPDAGGKCV